MSKRDESTQDYYAPLHNTLTEEFFDTDLSKTEIRILFFLVRYTYGYQECKVTKRRFDRVRTSYARMARELKTAERNIERSMARLIERNIVTVHEEPGACSAGVYGINSHASEWVKSCPRKSKSDKNVPDNFSGEMVKVVGENLPVNISGEVPDNFDGEIYSVSRVNTEVAHGLFKREKEKPPNPQGNSVVESVQIAEEVEPLKVVSIDRNREPLHQVAAMNIIRSIQRKFGCLGGVSYNDRESCRKLTSHYRDRLDELSKVFKSVMAEKLEWQRQSGKAIRRPFALIVNECDGRMKIPPKAKGYFENDLEDRRKRVV